MSKMIELLNDAYTALEDDDDLDIDTARGCVAHAKAIAENDGASFDIEDHDAEKTGLVDSVIHQIATDMDNLDLTELHELLMDVPSGMLIYFLKKERPNDNHNETNH